MPFVPLERARDYGVRHVKERDGDGEALSGSVANGSIGGVESMRSCRIRSNAASGAPPSAVKLPQLREFLGENAF
ncbi:MAG: hypothetical protein V4564_24390 [Pseudomonadota bacterium]